MKRQILGSSSTSKMQPRSDTENCWKLGTLNSKLWHDSPCGIISFSPLCLKADTVSHHVYVIAWNSGRTFDLTGSKEAATSCSGMYFRLDDFPKAIHSSCNCHWEWSETANTTTSMSTVRILNFLCPFWVASWMWMKILVYASSCVHGINNAVSWSAWFTSTFPHSLTYTGFSFSIIVTWLLSRENNSAFLSSTCRKSGQFHGTPVDGATFLCRPWPWFIHACHFKLSSW